MRFHGKGKDSPDVHVQGKFRSVMREKEDLVVQGHLFGTPSAVERFRVDEGTGIVSRTVTRSDIDIEPTTTEVGIWDRTIALDDLRAVADLAYLQQRSAPANPAECDELRVADLFSGVGCMSLGVAEACRAVGKRFTPLGAFDINQRVLQVYAGNFGVPAQEPCNLADVLSADLTAHASNEETALIERLGRVDMLVAGPPCQGHSNLNNHTRRQDPKNQLYFLLARFAQLCKPRWIIIENVIAVLNDKSEVVHRTQLALDELGYETDHGVVDLFTLGVPQTRRRHILIAQLRESAPDRNRPLGLLRDIVAPYVTRPRSVRWAIEDVIDHGNTSPMSRMKVPDPITQARIDYLFDNNLYDLPNSQRPDCHKGGGHSYGAVYGRMRWDEPAPTITGGFDTMGQGRFVHPKRRRTLTPQEAARLQFIPDFFDLSPLAKYRNALTEAIGNAVPPKLSYVLALELLR